MMNKRYCLECKCKYDVPEDCDRCPGCGELFLDVLEGETND